jgi:hypothetical protein
MVFPGQPQGMTGPAPPMGGSMFMNSIAQGGGNSLFSGYNTGPGNPAGMFPGLGMLNMITQPMIHGMMGNMGLVPGQFMGTQNIYDQYLNQQRASQQQQAIQQGAALDAGAGGVQQQTLINMGIVPGSGLDQMANAAGMTEAASQYTPIIAQMFPDLFDQMHGRKGSAQVLAQGLMRGGRYAIDPVTGLRELSASQVGGEDSSVETMMKEFQDTVNDPNSEMSQHGISMGQAGLMYEELNKRGMLGVRGIGTMTRDQQYERIAAQEGTSAEEVEQQATQAGPGGEEAFRTKLRQFDSKRVKSRVEGLSGAVDAMREIFGDLGNPNAPMSQIIEGLNQLTQGGVATMPAGNLERMVRMTKSIADNSGMGIDSIMALTASAAQIGDELGLNRSLAVVAGQRGAVGGRAVADMGWAGVFGTVSSDEAAAMITKSTEQGMASEAGMGTAALFRVQDQIAGGSFKPGSRAAKLMEAVKQGKSTFEGKPILDIMSNPQQMRGILKSSGLSDLEADSYQDFITDPAGNQKYMAEHPEIVDTIETMQMQEMGKEVAGRATARALSSVLAREKGLTEQQKKAVAAGMQDELGQEIWEEATADDRRDTESWNKFVSSKARPRLVEQLKGQGMSQAQAEAAADRMMPSLAARIESEGNRASQAHGYDNFDTALQTMGGQTLKQRQRIMVQSRQDADIRGALAPLSSRGPLRELMDVMQEGDVEWDKALGRVLGGIDPADSPEFGDAMKIIRDSRSKMEAIDGDRSGKWRDADGKLTKHGMDVRAQTVETMANAADSASAIAEKQGDSWLATTVDKKETKATADRFSELNTELNQQFIAGGPGVDPAKLRKAQDSAFRETGSLTNKFLGNVNSMKQLGKGGVDLVESLEADKSEVERLIEKHGSLEAARKAEGPKVNALLGRMNTTSAEIDKRFQAGAPAEGSGQEMTQEEIIRVEERQNEARTAPDERRQQVLETLADLAGLDTATMTAEEKKELLGQIGSGGDLAQIEQAAKREQKIRELEKKKADGSITAEEQKELDQLESSGGRVFENLDGSSTAGDVSTLLEDEYERDDAYVEEAELGDQAPLVKGIERALKNIKIDAMKLTIHADGGAEAAPENPADTPP